jgi:hypothetical protein
VIVASQIAQLQGSAVDFGDAEALKSKLAKLRAQRHPFFLTASDFDDILRWKLRQQYGRQRGLRGLNTGEIVRSITGLAFTITHHDKDYELELRVAVLCALRGVGVPVASAILALTLPEEYAVIDFRGWRQVFDEYKTTFSIPDYKKYLHEIHQLAAELGWAAQEVDLAIWEYDRRQSQTRASVKTLLEGSVSTILTLGTLSRRTQFSYTGSARTGVTLNFSGKPYISAEFFRAILSAFRGKDIRGGFSMTKPTSGGLGEWVRDNSARMNAVSLTPRHASFIAAILVHEGLITSELRGNAVHLHF